MRRLSLCQGVCGRFLLSLTAGLSQLILPAVFPSAAAGDVGAERGKVAVLAQCPPAYRSVIRVMAATLASIGRWAWTASSAVRSSFRGCPWPMVR